MASSRLNIKTQTSIDPMREYPNPNGASRVDDCADGRPTETAAIQQMDNGIPIEAPAGNALRYNGVLVDLDTQLYCRGCQSYLFDREFDRDRTLINNINRRGRCYKCKSCRAGKLAPMDASTVKRLTKGSKRRKKK